MASAIPPTVESLLAAADEAARDTAWTEFLKRYSGLILHVARSTRGDHDSVMDRYLFVLEALRKNECRRVRAYSNSGRGAFSTWLVAVTRRLCIDEHRRRFGRTSAKGPTVEQVDRRALDALSGDESAPLDSLESALARPDSELQITERNAALRAALLRLDVSDRLLLRLRYEDSLKVNEIARLLGEQSQFKVYRRLDQILATLRHELELVGIRDSDA
ncbi:MAG: sigma-70 family RNA polymerase sigma factor [Gemmatimonadaceae bacterium]